MRIYDSLLPTPTATDAQEGIRKSTQVVSGSKHSVTLKQAINMKNLYSREVSPANHSPKLDEEKERATTAISGQKCLELYESSTQHGSSLKTCVGLLLGTKDWYSNKCALTWKVKATKSNRLLFQLSPSMRRTEEIESGLLPTVTTGETEHPNMVVTEDGRRAPTKGLTSFKIGLADKVRMIPTPATRDWKGGSMKNPRDTVDSLVETGATKGGTGIRTGLKLHSDFASWMMGYPIDWLDL